ncbi:hypothetical protein [Leptospira jelokensis]|uniref:Uncharacterized protein n=1 Tax=Leptospira jelokensis TaxID=2484931 RepID=A0A4Z0ZVS4_9LEPT|nr:hypothetical protein [Leptospira jelokensis]TGL58635.1 hypothetical protein EHQ62_17220 [Leptospira jelokensis]
MKSITLQDWDRLKLQNQFTIPGDATATDPETGILTKAKRIFYITRILATAGWTIIGEGNNADPQLRSITITGNGTEKFEILPLCFSKVTTLTGITSISGFWISASEF